MAPVIAGTARPVASRARKARRDGLCGGSVLTGQRIGLVDGLGWAHVTCVIAAQRAA